MEHYGLLCEIKSYLDTQRFGVTSKTISKRVSITPKLTRYLIRTYLSEHTVNTHHKHKLIKLV